MNRRKPLSEDFVLELLDNTIAHYAADSGRFYILILNINFEKSTWRISCFLAGWSLEGGEAYLEITEASNINSNVLHCTDI